ncbi:MAG: hypothetical protein JXC32_02435 [Anaerolineae bacterium]|nr:hypothetical protein [Anaerolineae bacterium]
MPPLSIALIAGTLILPLVGSLWLMVAKCILPEGRHAMITGPIIGGVAALCTVGLLWVGEQDVPLPTWIPGAGPMSLHLGGLGGQIAALTTVMLFVSLLLMGDRDDEMTSTLLLAALSAANASFLAGHFLFRYLALEIVGLCIGLAPLLASKGDGLEQAKGTYLLLRLGDVGLLGAILILGHASGTLTVGPALQVGARLSHPAATWIVGGLLLAIWVKTGLWPFHRWQSTASDLPPTTGAWLYGLVMPNLGLYLLYRTIPLLTTAPWLVGIGIFLAILGVATILIRSLLQQRGRVDSASVGTILSAVALLIAVYGKPLHLAAMVLITTPLRTIVWLAQVARDDRSGVFGRPECQIAGRDGRLARGSEGTIIAIADWFSRRVEKPIAQKGITRLWELLFASARWLNLWVETRIAQEGIIRLWHFFVGTALAWHRTSEQRAVTGIVHGTAQGAMSVSHWLQKLHTGKLRVNLQWTVAALALVVAWLVVTGW